MAVSTPAHGPGDVVTGLLLQITQHAERLAVVDQREADHAREIKDRLDELARELAVTGERVDSVYDVSARQATLLETLNGLDEQVATLTGRLTEIAADRKSDENGEPYQLVPAPRWWKLDGAEHEEALARLRAWVEQVYRPGYGHLAATLAPCWDQHPLCLYGLDWLMELWSALYLTSERTPGTLASQAEWQTRLLPALAEQLHLETTRCEHTRPASGTPKQAVENALNRRSPANL
jgi:hypothetical protein